MNSMKHNVRGAGRIAPGIIAILLLVAARGAAAGAALGAEWMEHQAAGQSALTQKVGTVKAISGTMLTLALDGGPEVSVTVKETTKIVQVAPGQKDLKSATAIQLKDLQTGDRILVRGTSSEDGKTMAAAGIIAMKHADLDAKQAQEREDWQKRGTGGLVSAVDAAAGTITITTGAGATKRTIVIHATKNTVVRRYAPESVDFNDAKLARLDQIGPGDQLRARGTKNEDGSEFTADEIVSGSFRNISGVISSVDASAKTLSLTDLITKKPVVVKITDQSQLRKMPAQMAQIVAMRLKGVGAGSGAAGGNGAPGGANGGATSGGAPGAGQPGGRGGDLQQIVNRLPAATIGDFQKGDAVMVVSTQGPDSGSVTAITLLGGVEPILAAAPSGGQGMTLSPWSIGAPSGVTGGGDQ